MTTTTVSPLRDGLFRSGYVVVPDVIDPRGVLQPVLDEYAEVLDGLARDLAAAGSISSSYEDLPFEARLIQIAKESGATHTQHFDITLLTGSDAAILEYLILGAEGALIGFAAIATDLNVAMWQAARDGEYAKAPEIWDRLWPLATYCWSPPIRDMRPRMKEALVLSGIFPEATVRAPQLAVSSDEVDAIREALKQGGLLP